MRIGLLIAVAITLVAAWMGRYDIATAGADQAPTAFVLDRWTGKVRMVRGPYIREAIEAPPPNPFDKFDKAAPNTP